MVEKNLFGCVGLVHIGSRSVYWKTSFWLMTDKAQLAKKGFQGWCSGPCCPAAGGQRHLTWSWQHTALRRAGAAWQLDPGAAALMSSVRRRYQWWTAHRAQPASHTASQQCSQPAPTAFYSWLAGRNWGISNESVTEKISHFHQKRTVCCSITARKSDLLFGASPPSTNCKPLPFTISRSSLSVILYRIFMADL